MIDNTNPFDMTPKPTKMYSSVLMLTAVENNDTRAVTITIPAHGVDDYDDFVTRVMKGDAVRGRSPLQLEEKAQTAPIIKHALDVFPDGVEKALNEHVAEFLADPSAKNAADVQWLLLTKMTQHGIKVEDLNQRYDQLVSRLNTTGKITS